MIPERTGEVMDEEFRKLNRAALPPARETIDDRILAARVVRKAEAAATRRLMEVAELFSIGGGVVAGSAFVQSAIVGSQLTAVVSEWPITPDGRMGGRLWQNGRGGG